MLGGDEVGDGFGFDLCRAAASEGLAVVEGSGVVQQDVAELVGERLHGLGVVDVVTDDDCPLGEVGVAVRPVVSGDRLPGRR